MAIEADLEASPWEGEGYRKVWARLRVCRDIRVARKRVLRLMRENNLLSPHRCRRRGGNPHDGEIITHAPNLMWGTDGVRVFTVDDGWGWIFTAVEHWNAECVGWHVCKRGDRFAALQPISMGLAGLYGSTAAGAARGLALRMDHGSQYLSDHFTNQIKFWGIQPSYAFVAEPQTNGVAERFNRTLKEQIIHGRIYRNIAELRDAVRDFVELYNAQWIVEKNGYLTPLKLVRRGTPRSQSGPPRETNLCPRNRVRYITMSWVHELNAMRDGNFGNGLCGSSSLSVVKNREYTDTQSLGTVLTSCALSSGFMLRISICSAIFRSGARRLERRPEMPWVTMFPV